MLPWGGGLSLTAAMLDTDIVIVGGGPVGLVAALEARRKGLDAVVIEPREPPIDKPCGQGIMPAGVHHLRDLGVEPTGAPIPGITYVDGERQAVASFPHGHGLGVRRTELSARLWEAVDAAGVRVIRDAATEFAMTTTDVAVMVRSGEEVRGAYLLGADGLHSAVRRLFSPRVLAPRGLRRFGFVTHLPIELPTGQVEVQWCDAGEVYLTPLPGQAGVAVLARRGTTPDAVLAGVPRVREMVGGADFGGAGAFLQVPTRHVRGRMLLIGDAAGYVDALTGEGLTVGFAQARAAVRAVVAGNPAGYERDWWRVSTVPFALAGGLVGATRVPAVRRRIVPVAAAAPRLFSSLVGLVAGADEAQVSLPGE